MKGTLYLIPSPLGDSGVEAVIPAGTLSVLNSLRYFAVEELRSARRYLSAAGLRGKIDSLELFLLNEHTKESEIDDYIKLLLDGNSLGVVSEAGLPAVADPGGNLVARAHREGILVKPLTGPSSLMLALMASGKNGQGFTFCGYLPVKSEDRRSRIKELERNAAKTGNSQIFIETPYRNDSLMSDLLMVCSPGTYLTVAQNISLQDEFIKTLSVEEWRKRIPVLNKKPCVFIL